MKDIKIGNLVFNKKAVAIIAFCLFIDGLLIGAMAAADTVNGSGIFPLFYLFLFLPYIIFYKSIRQNIRELK